jgi:hypothetical protein
MKNQFIPLYLLFLLMGSSCFHELREGEKMMFTAQNFQKHWDAIKTGESDSLILNKSGEVAITRFTIKNFRLSIDLYTTNGAEGSVDFHTDSEPIASLRGYSVKINNSDYRSGSPQKTGSLSLIRNNFVRTAKDNQWFNLVIEVRGTNIKTFVNGKLITDYTQALNDERIPALENVRIASGNIKIRKYGDNGTITIGQIDIERYQDEMAVESTAKMIDDSSSLMLSQLNQQEFPVIDYHGHLKGGLTVDQVSTHGRFYGYNFGLAPNCGLNFPVTNDSSLVAFYDDMAPEPVFKAMQCEGREWVTLFSPEAIALYDYIFTDAMTWTDHKGRRLRLWIPEETFVDDEQQFMDMLVEKIVAILTLEPVDIYVNPTYLPIMLAGKYNELWTVKRMDKVIKALVENDVAVEINARFRIPGIEFVKRAKHAGVKFTLGTNNAGSDDLGILEYSLRIVKDAGLTPGDMFIPRPSGDKKVLSKGLPGKITG